MRNNNCFPEGFECYLKRVVIPIEIPKGAKNGEDLLKNRMEYHGQCKAILTVDKSKVISVDLRSETLCTIPIEFPRYNYAWNAQEYKYMYGAMIFKSEEEPLAGLVKVNVQNKSRVVWRRDNDTQMCTEPIFVAKPGAIDEDDGVIMSAVITFYQDDMPFILVLDARTFEEAARCYIAQRVPFELHGITTSNNK